MKKVFLLILIPLIATACKVSYSFNGASIDYNLIKTISISDFQNQAPLVYAPLTQVFNEEMKDVFTRNTKLRFTETNADIEIEGEIIRYDFTPQSVKEDAFASETRFTISVRMRYRNNKKPEEDKEETFTAYRDFNSNQSVDAVQDQLIEQISKEIVDQIFNSTMSNW